MELPLLLICFFLSVSSLTLPPEISSPQFFIPHSPVVARGNPSHTDPSFNESHTLGVLHFAWAAYCSASSLRSWTCPYCYTGDSLVEIVEDNITSTFSFVACDKVAQTLYVSFRGTVDLPNWITDFDFVKVPDLIDDPEALVHAGFYRAYNRVRQGILSAVNDALQQQSSPCFGSSRMVVTGHSLGAALSGLCALDLRKKFKNIPNLHIELNNFGMPRLGNVAFAYAFPGAVNVSWRMVHQADIVPHLPLQLMGYRHIATEVWSISSNSTFAKAFIGNSNEPSNSYKGAGLGERTVRAHQIQSSLKLSKDFLEDSDLIYIVCRGGEDEKCSDSVPIEQWNSNDHNVYMGEGRKC